MVFCGIIVALLMFIYLIDHPYFDIFQGKNDSVFDDDNEYQVNKKVHKHQERDSKHHKSKNSKHKK